MDKKRTEIVLEYGFWMKLKWIALSQGMSLAGLFRKVLTQYIEDYERTKETNTKTRRES